MIQNKQNCWKVSILTLFPEMYPGPLGISIAGKALLDNLWQVNAYNIRDFSLSKHLKVDDKPYGGGAGMVIRADVLGPAIEKLQQENKFDEIIYLSPRGNIFNQKKAAQFISQNILFICGRYEGIDYRVIEYFNIKELSVGDYILSSGDIALISILDSCVRLLPNVLKKSEATQDESFSSDENHAGLLEYNHYTRPAEWNGLAVPKVLLSGNHQQVKLWRTDISEQLTRNRRPDLWDGYNKIKK